MPKFQLISIEGNIGSGKSTLLHHLKNKYGDETNFIFLKEPVDDWDVIRDEEGITMLSKFYSDKPKYSFAFQMMAYISRLANLRKVIRDLDENANTIIISERSLHTDKEVFAKMLFDTGFIELVNYKIYLNWYNAFIDDCPVSKVIYVNTKPTICFDRIRKRLRDGESNISLDYLSTCHEYHEKMLDISTDSCVCNRQLVLNGDADIFCDVSVLHGWLDQIHEFILS
jgi:deoxyadenosine/deoxycytidine kinase